MSAVVWPTRSRWTVAAEAKVRFRTLLMVRHERGQSVNALAATSSGTIYVAEGLHEDLQEGGEPAHETTVP